MESGELYLAHEDGDSPTPLFVSAAPGESGVLVLRLQFPGGAYYGATLRQQDDAAMQESALGTDRPFTAMQRVRPVIGLLTPCWRGSPDACS